MTTDKLIEALVQDLRTPTVAIGASMRRYLPLAIGLLMVWLMLMGIRSDVLSTGFRPTLVKVAVGVALAALGLMVAVRLSRPEAASTKPILMLLAVPAIAIIGAATEAPAGNWLDLLVRFWRQSYLSCLIIIPVLAVVPLAATLLSLRHGATTRPKTVGALAGLGSAGLAMIAFGFYCTQDTFIAAWYVLAGCISGVVGACAGRFLLRW